MIARTATQSADKQSTSAEHVTFSHTSSVCRRNGTGLRADDNARAEGSVLSGLCRAPTHRRRHSCASCKQCFSPPPESTGFREMPRHNTATARDTPISKGWTRTRCTLLTASMTHTVPSPSSTNSRHRHWEQPRERRGYQLEWSGQREFVRSRSFHRKDARSTASTSSFSGRPTRTSLLWSSVSCREETPSLLPHTWRSICGPKETSGHSDPCLSRTHSRFLQPVQEREHL